MEELMPQSTVKLENYTLTLSWQGFWKKAKNITLELDDQPILGPSTRDELRTPRTVRLPDDSQIKVWWDKWLIIEENGLPVAVPRVWPDRGRLHRVISIALLGYLLVISPIQTGYITGKWLASIVIAGPVYLLVWFLGKKGWKWQGLFVVLAYAAVLTVQLFQTDFSLWLELPAIFNVVLMICALFQVYPIQAKKQPGNQSVM